jgi:hypothetical protein
MAGTLIQRLRCLPRDRHPRRDRLPLLDAQ